MRVLIGLLLLANLSFLLYTQLEHFAPPVPTRFDRQVAPERLKLLTPQQVAALGPAKAAQLPNVCLQWGPFTDAELGLALPALQDLQLGRQLSTRRIEVSSAWWVWLPPLRNRPEADARLAELRRLGLQDLYVITENGPLRFAISLGVFKSEETARRFMASLDEKGVTGASVGPRPQPVTQTVLVVRDPQQPQIARFQELKPAYPGTEVRIGDCP